MNGLDIDDEFLVPPKIMFVTKTGANYKVKGQALDSDAIKIYALGSFGENYLGSGTPAQFVGSGITINNIPFGTVNLRADAVNNNGVTGIGSLFYYPVNFPVEGFKFDSENITFDSTIKTFDLT